MAVAVVVVVVVVVVGSRPLVLEQTGMSGKNRSVFKGLFRFAKRQHIIYIVCTYTHIKHIMTGWKYIYMFCELMGGGSMSEPWWL